MQVAASFVDCTVGLALVYFGVGASSVLTGLVAGYSRWIWTSSEINRLLSRFDKLMVGKLLGSQNRAASRRDRDVCGCCSPIAHETAIVLSKQDKFARLDGRRAAFRELP